MVHLVPSSRDTEIGYADNWLRVMLYTEIFFIIIFLIVIYICFPTIFLILTIMSARQFLPQSWNLLQAVLVSINMRNGLVLE